MKKVIDLFLVVTIIITLSGCDSKKDEKNNNSSNNNSSNLVEENVNTSIYKVAMNLTSIWNDYIVNIRDYSKKGTNSIGQTLDIDFLIENFKIDYEKFQNNKEFVNSLSDEHKQFKNAFNKAIEQLDIIYEGATKNIPKANEEVPYIENIDLFKQYFDVVYDYAIELDY